MKKAMEFPRSSWTWIALSVILAWPASSVRGTAPTCTLPSPGLSAIQSLDDEKADREQEQQDREQEKRDREQEKLDRQQELDDEGQEALDEGNYEKAVQKYDALAQRNGPQTDKALYWKAWAERKLGRRDAAVASLSELYRRFPQSRWVKDGKALEVEVRQSSGTSVPPESFDNEELKLLAIRGLMNSDPERAAPMLEKVLAGNSTPKQKREALFVLSQSGSSKAREILGRIARGQQAPELQRKAIESLGLYGGSASRQELSDIYASTADAGVKRAILRAFMLSGEKDRIFAAAKGEKDAEVRREAIRQLGLMGSQSELQQLYQSESSTDVKREILQSFFLGGGSSKLLEVARTDKDPEMRRTAIRNLGLMGSGSSEALTEIYTNEKERSIRREVLNAFFLQGNAKALIAVARKETDSELKKEAVSKLSLMGSKEATDFLMEILNQK
ncbi:MAG TPA: HEAT repeat domain-containing protein [Candidatus Acidoferrales bacterium]|nr:HEAT repeat domain-containing protein [Candidatus Acidoferrales bacterium]